MEDNNTARELKLASKTEFKKYKGKIRKLYSDDKSLIEALGGRYRYYNVNRLDTREKQIKEVKDSLQDVTKARKMSETLLALNGSYAEILQYYSNMPLYRYTVIPIKTKNKDAETTEEKYKESYDKMIKAVDGLSMEVVLPDLLELGMTYGSIYLYGSADKSAETVETLVLPYAYCQPGFKTNFGTTTVIFDFSYFDELIRETSSAMNTGVKLDIEELLDLFPRELISQYELYRKDKTMKYQTLDPKLSAAINFSRSGIPPKLTANFGIADYTIMKANEVKRSMNELEKILVHQIPHTPDGDLIFEIEEAIEIHNEMARAIQGSIGVKLLTTFGKTDLLSLADERSKEDKRMEQAHDGIFLESGVNPHIFKGHTPQAIRATIAKDASYVFKHLDLIVNYYNLIINNLYSFGPFEVRINLLRMTVYDEEDKVKLYRESASFGIGKLEALVAAGVRQRDIADKHELEKYLDLDNILVPLQSAHTTSSKDKKEQEDEDPPAPKEEEVEQVKQEEVENE